MGEIRTMVPANAAAAIFNRNDHVSFTNRSNAMAQPAQRYKGFTRNQHAIPSAAPAARASSTLLRCAASINSQLPPSTNHVVGASAEGNAAYIANNGESATRNPAASAACLSETLSTIPAISSSDKIKSRNHSTSCTEYAD